VGLGEERPVRPDEPGLGRVLLTGQKAEQAAHGGPNRAP
jgi:hypothetical protein